MKCIYGREKVAILLRERFLRKIERFAGEPIEGRDEQLANELSQVAWRYAQLAKHEHFAEEVEWRYIVNAPAADIQYRIGSFGLTPFLPTEQLTITKVWIGPRVGPDAVTAQLIVMDYLRQTGIEADVAYWTSPFRG